MFLNLMRHIKFDLLHSEYERNGVYKCVFEHLLGTWFCIFEKDFKLRVPRNTYYD